MQSDIEMAVQWSKKLETLLEVHLGATGRGLHEKINSVQQRLPVATSRKLRFIATIRNKIVHETGYSRIEDRTRFERTCSDVVSELNNVSNSPRKERSQPETNSHGDHHKISPRTGSAVKPGLRFASLSLWLAIVGGIVGFVIPTIHGEGLMLSLGGALMGLIAGFYWQAVVTALLLAVAIIAVFWLLTFAYHSVR